MCLPSADKALALEALLLLAVARAIVWGLPMRLWRQWVDLTPPELDGPLGERAPRLPSSPVHALRVADTVRKVSRALPWLAHCLHEAMATQWMLRRRRVPSTLVFGAALSGSPPAAVFHAWLCVSGEAVIGGEEAQRYTAFPIRA